MSDVLVNLFLVLAVIAVTPLALASLLMMGVSVAASLTALADRLHERRLRRGIQTIEDMLRERS